MYVSKKSLDKIWFDISRQEPDEERVTAACGRFFAEHGGIDSDGACVVFRELLMSVQENASTAAKLIHIEVEKTGDRRFVIRVQNPDSENAAESNDQPEFPSGKGLNERSLILLHSLAQRIEFGVNGNYAEAYVLIP